MTVLPAMVTVKSGHSRGGSMDTRTHLHNKLIRKDQNRKTQSYKVESLSGGANVDIHNFSLENKRETEYVSHSQTHKPFAPNPGLVVFLEEELCYGWSCWVNRHANIVYPSIIYQVLLFWPKVNDPLAGPRLSLGFIQSSRTLELVVAVSASGNGFLIPDYPDWSQPEITTK